MKGILVAAIFSASVIALGSCKKCVNCTYTDDQNVTLNDSSVCGKGKVYQEQLDQFEKSGWKCTDTND